MRNSKFEIRNPKQTRNRKSKIQNGPIDLRQRFGHLRFGFWICFGLPEAGQQGCRASDFELPFSFHTSRQ